MYNSIEGVFLFVKPEAMRVIFSRNIASYLYERCASVFCERCQSPNLCALSAFICLPPLHLEGVVKYSFFSCSIVNYSFLVLICVYSTLRISAGFADTAVISSFSFCFIVIFHFSIFIRVYLRSSVVKMSLPSLPNSQKTGYTPRTFTAIYTPGVN